MLVGIEWNKLGMKRPSWLKPLRCDAFLMTVFHLFYKVHVSKKIMGRAFCMKPSVCLNDLSDYCTLLTPKCLSRCDHHDYRQTGNRSTPCQQHHYSTRNYQWKMSKWPPFGCPEMLTTTCRCKMSRRFVSPTLVPLLWPCTLISRQCIHQPSTIHPS